MEHSVKTLAINSIKYYNNINTYISRFSDTNILKQYYMQKSKLIGVRDNINLPAKDTKPVVRCPKCCMNRLQNNSQYRITPSVVKSRFLRRVKKKIDTEKLTKYQLKCAKKLRKCLGSQMVIKCNICQTEVKEVLVRPFKQKDAKIGDKPFIQVFDKPSKQKETIKVTNKLHTQNAKTNKNTLNETRGKHSSKKKKQQNSKKMIQQMDKMNHFLNKSHKLKPTNLKSFIKSVT